MNMISKYFIHLAIWCIPFALMSQGIRDIDTQLDHIVFTVLPSIFFATVTLALRDMSKP